MKRTTAQNARFHALLTARKFDKEEKAALVLTYTQGRSESSKDMSKEEMAEAIKHLEGLEMASIRKMRAKIINIAKDIFRVADMMQADWDNLNVFLTKKFKGKLNELDYETLRKAVTAMEKWKQSEDKKRTGKPTQTAQQEPQKQPVNQLYRPYIDKPKAVIESPWLIMKDRDTVDEFGDMYEEYTDQLVEIERQIAGAESIDPADIRRIRQLQATLTHMSHLYNNQPFRREN
ncbi:hypothetical protein WBJ53_08665 [Spirosoma sp. SC4-14]|uniref:hypothetical protein n=1 Tax=Spirosoma sp. SC4-14 TaxID=3128900 RepID=UPI0030CB9A70